MDKKETENKLNKYPGVDVKAIDHDGLETFYFYEDFKTETNGIDRAMKQMYGLINKGKIKQVEFIANQQNM